MKLSLIKIGNSQGVRLPVSIIKQCHFSADIDAVVKNGSLILTASEDGREMWQDWLMQNGDNLKSEEEWKW